MLQNRTKAKLKAGETVYGCFVRYPDASLIEVMGYSGWDFLMFDGEHGVLEPRDAEHLVRAAELRQVTPIVRVPTNQPATILRLLDTGAQGLHVPWVNSAAEAEAAVRSVKYQPRGQRGLAGVRAADYGQLAPLAEYCRAANEESLVVIHVETITAVRALPEIVKIPDIDVLFIGPTDLSHSLGHPGQPQHPEVQAAMDEVLRIVLPTGIAVGILVQNVNSALEWKRRGARYISTTVEAMLCPASKEYLRVARG